MIDFDLLQHPSELIARETEMKMYILAMVMRFSELIGASNAERLMCQGQTLYGVLGDRTWKYRRWLHCSRVNLNRLDSSNFRKSFA